MYLKDVDGPPSLRVAICGKSFDRLCQYVRAISFRVSQSSWLETKECINMKSFLVTIFFPIHYQTSSFPNHNKTYGITKSKSSGFRRHRYVSLFLHESSNKRNVLNFSAIVHEKLMESLIVFLSKGNKLRTGASLYHLNDPQTNQVLA